MPERQSDHSALAVGIVAGMVGAGLALLFAPRTGKETRNMLQASARDMADRAHETADKANEMRERIASAIRTTGKKAADKADETADKLDSSAKSPLTTDWNEEEV